MKLPFRDTHPARQGHARSLLYAHRRFSPRRYAMTALYRLHHVDPNVSLGIGAQSGRCRHWRQRPGSFEWVVRTSDPCANIACRICRHKELHALLFHTVVPECQCH